MRIWICVAAIVLAGCASKQYQWEKSGATQDEFHRDRGQCMQATFSSTFATAMQQQMIYASCMNGKGWYSVEVR
jgi:hypothetical protein